ncbi:helix-turn-helix domain-containing protein [Deinococcus marmoris]|uniref:helix-turn-helix domain-containing protein n=1 Tax=Deinococcus marmoris TaxID=249408 RepID=UPI00049782A9|nr:helix-turn-helix transcriptional regulator [Deinococcus marmoris]
MTVSGPLDDSQRQERLEKLGQRIKQLREERKWSQDTFAHLAGMNRAYPNKIEKAKIDVRYTTLVRIAHVFGLTVGELLTFEDSAL